MEESASFSADVVPELPTTSALQHLGKARPKRAKRHAPSRGAVVTSSPATDQGDGEDISKFYNNSFNASFSPSSTPGGSPPVEENRSRIGSVSSSTSILSSSRRKNKEESEKPTEQESTPVSSKDGKLSGLSCLSSSTIEDGDTGKDYLLKPGSKSSPEKRSLSPSIPSLGDIFSGSKASPKIEAGGHKIAGLVPLSPGVSPFAARKTPDHPVPEPRRTSLNASEDKTESEPVRTPHSEEVVKRVGVGHGGNLDLMAEMREKRASMVHKPSTSNLGEEESAKSSATASSSGGGSGDNLFGRVKLRSTGLVGSLSSPDAKSPTSESAEANKGSIVGMRSTKFSSSQPPSFAQSKEEPNSPSTDGSPSSLSMTAKPKPLPKPRPWSIVGVDRKSGEMTSVGGSGSSSTDPPTTAVEKPAPGVKPSASPLISASNSASRKSSVRDLINNMNKVERESPPPSVETGRRKGSSLPRGVAPPSASSGTTSSKADADSADSSAKKQSTSDDPRILKLDDDFAYDDVLDV